MIPVRRECKSVDLSRWRYRIRLLITEMYTQTVWSPRIKTCLNILTFFILTVHHIILTLTLEFQYNDYKWQHNRNLVFHSNKVIPEKTFLNVTCAVFCKQAHMSAEFIALNNEGIPWQNYATRSLSSARSIPGIGSRLKAQNGKKNEEEINPFCVYWW